jgi:GrpB-like predicted nucleotidyltransferase (UPF0157 family)
MFQKLSGVYVAHLGDLVTAIHHVGSTSVPGLAAKPIIDIDLVIKNSNLLPAVIEKLAVLGYEHVGNLGISDREAFRGQTECAPVDGTGKVWPKHNLYVCPEDSISLKNHLTLRDFLRANPDAAKDYGDLKKRLAAENPNDIDLYIERKTPFIVGVLQRVGFNKEALDKIVEENRMK